VITQASHDYGLTYGSDWRETMILYADARVTRWRGAYNKDFLYLAGDGVGFQGEAFVALREDARTDPGPDNTAFWSPATPLNLTGYIVQIVCDGAGGWEGFTVNPGIEPLLGKLNVVVPTASLAGAPSSARWYLRVIEPDGAIMEPPIHGALLFRAP
jgi:hypothetical protein